MFVSELFLIAVLDVPLSLSLQLWCQSLGCLKIVEDDNVRDEIEHVLLTATMRHLKQVP